MSISGISKWVVWTTLAVASVGQAKDVVKKKGNPLKKEVPAQAASEMTVPVEPSPAAPPIVIAQAGPHAGHHEAMMGNRPSPFAANPSPFEEILDQTFLPTEPTAKILRVSRPFVGVSYQTASGSYKRSLSGTATKTTVDASIFGIEAVYPTPIGLRVGGFYTQFDGKQKQKSDTAEATLKVPVTSKGILVAGAFRNGIGAGLALHDVEEKISSGNVSIEEHYGYLLPSLYYGNQSTEVVLTHRRSMRHRTFTTDGMFRLDVEQSFGSMNGVLGIQNSRRSENDDDEKDNFAGIIGLRFMLEQKSFVLATLGFEEPYHTSPKTASVFSVASQSASISTDYFVAPEHVVGGALEYTVSEGRGGENLAGEKTKLSGSSLSFGASYSFRM